MQSDSLTPSSLYQQCLDKQRIVVCGTRGTTSLATLLVNVLQYYKRPVDFSLNAPLHGMTETVRLSDAHIVVIDGKEKDLHEYHHHVGVITNILWNTSMEVGTEEEYVKFFEHFADSTPKGGMLFYCENDPLAMFTGTKPRTDVLSIPYKIHPHSSESGKHFLVNGSEKTPVQVYGSQGFQNFSAAREVLKRLGVTYDMFYKAVPHFLP
jgi:UDP-N-acetylmuramate: L-alanyl-gamma-D-glutamyl-meso-diaminopimelate ligase